MKKRIIIVIVVLILLAFFFLRGDSPQEQDEVATEIFPTVQTALVSELSKEVDPVISYGQIISADSIAVVPEVPGVVKRVYKQLGDTVAAGEVVVELQNSSQQQAILQARSGLSSSVAQLSQVQSGADIEDVQNQQVQVSQAELGLAEAQIQAKQFVDSALVTLETLIEDQLDFFFSGGDSDPDLKFTTREFGDTKTLENDRFAINGIIDELDEKLRADFNNSTDAELFLNDLEAALDFSFDLTDLLTAVVDDQPNSILREDIKEQYRSVIRPIRQAIITERNDLSRQIVGLDSAKTTLEIAQNNLQKIQDGADQEDLVVAQSQVNVSESNLASAQIELSKTFIKAPAFGRISSIETRVGQLVGSSPVFTLSSSGSKRVDTFLAADQVARIAIGSRALIDGRYQGVVSRIAPAIDNQNGKVKVEVLFTGSIPTVVEGAGVGLQIEVDETIEAYVLPIEALFVRGETSFVYVLSSDGTVQPREVVVDSLFGQNITVTDGLGPQDEIILFARGLKDGERVSTGVMDDEVQETTEQVEESSQETRVLEISEQTDGVLLEDELRAAEDNQ